MVPGGLAKARWPALWLGLAAAYFFSGKLGLSLAFVHASSTAVWPPTGIALAAYLVWGPRAWPGVFLGAFLVNITTTGSFVTCLGIASGNTLEGLVGAALVNRFAGGPSAFERPQGIFVFALAAALAATMVSATIGVASLCLTGYASWSGFWPIWLTWWLGDAVGAQIVAPAGVLWLAGRPLLGWNRRSLEVVLLAGTLLFVGFALFGGITHLGLEDYPLAFLCVPVPLWAAFRMGQRAAVTSVMVLSGIAVWGTVRGSGPLRAASENESLLVLQTYMGLISLTALSVAASVRQGQRAEEDLRKLTSDLEGRVKERTSDLSQALERLATSEEKFRTVAQTATDAIISADGGGNIVFCNPAAERIFGYATQELIGKPLTVLMPERFHEPHWTGLSRLIKSGESRIIGKTVELVGMKKEGDEFPVEMSLGAGRTKEGTFFTGILRDITDRKASEGRLVASLQEKEVLLREIHHRVKNNLQIVWSLLNVQSRALKDEESHEALEESRDRIKTMALIHESLYGSQDVARIRFEQYIRSLASYLLRSYGNERSNVSLVVSVDPIPMDVDRAISVGLIVNELVANALKHAFPGSRPGRIRIEIHASNPERAVLKVSDDGIGMPAGLDLEKTASVGLGLVRSLARQLGGQVALGRNGGTEFEVRFPLREGS